MIEFLNRGKGRSASARQDLLQAAGRVSEFARGVMSQAGMFVESAGRDSDLTASVGRELEQLRDQLNDQHAPATLTFESAEDARIAVGESVVRPDWQGNRFASAEAAAMAAYMSSAGPAAYANRVMGLESAKHTFDPSTAVINSHVPDALAMKNLPEDLLNKVLATEAYDTTEMSLMNEYSVSFNYDGSYGSLFTETLYPTIAINPNHVGLEVMAKVHVVQDYVTHATSGAVSNWNRRNILFAHKDHTLLKKDTTTLVPVYRAGAAAKFVDTAVLPAVNVIVDGVSIPTSSLKIGEDINYLGLSQTDAQLQGGSVDGTDSIEPSVTLRYLDFKFGADIIRIQTADMATATFVEGQQTQDRVMQLFLNVDNVALTKETLAVGGAAPVGTEMAKIKSDDLIVTVQLKAFATINLNTGVVNVAAASATLNGISKVQADGTRVDMLATYGALAAVIDGGKQALGFDIRAYSTNSNFRRFGDIVDTITFKRVYTVPRRSPIIARRPLNADPAVDRDDLQAMIATIKARLNNEAVTALLTQFDTLYPRAQAYKRDATDLIPEQFGLGAFYFRPYAQRVVDFDLSTVVDSLKSSDRMEDLQAALLTVIRQHVYEMYNLAEMDPGLEQLFGSGAKRPEVIIATDQLISKYLMQGGETRTLGPGFDFRVVETIDDRFTNRIFLTFGVFNQSTNQHLSPAHWGNMLWVPEVTQSVSPRSSNGQVSKEVFVTPRYLFVNNLPVATMMTLKANTIKELTQKKVVLWTDER